MFGLTMVKTITCPHCGRELEISQALGHELEEKIRLEAEEVGRKREKELLEEIRDIKKKDRDRELELEKKLIASEEKIWAESRKKAEEEHRLKDLEKEKKMQELLVQVEELKRRAQQGSQQSQGEVLELELEELLKKEFPGDKISEVAKGVRGADVVQEVVDKYGRNCGTILWESKNAKWSEGWLSKLAEDKRETNANVAVLVSINLPAEVKNFAYIKGVWVTGMETVIGLAWSLRISLGQVFVARQASEGKTEKASEIYDYITGVEFKNRVEGVLESYVSLLDELEKEKRWFAQKWAREEKEIRKIMDNTGQMYGELQGMSGRALPEIKLLGGQ